MNKHMLKDCRKKLGIGVVLLSLLTSGGSSAKINSVDLINDALSCIDCIDYRVIGVCFWLKCKLFSCSVKTSVKISHYNPDMVVSTYTSESPWGETKSWNSVKHGAMTTAQSNKKLESNLDFKHADVITHPALAVGNILEQTGYYCKSMQKAPYMPLFLSRHDPFWMESTVEGILASTVGLLPTSGNVIKAEFLGSSWARVYPRCGWGNHPYDPINGAVAAHRVAEIVTRNLQPHVYQPAGGNCGNRCWKPASVVANNNTNKFQMNYPKSENSASPMGGKASWANGKNKPEEAYAWTLWRKYKCCKKEGQVFITSVDWE